MLIEEECFAVEKGLFLERRSNPWPSKASSNDERAGSC